MRARQRAWFAAWLKLKERFSSFAGVIDLFATITIVRRLPFG
jgi:hypothetical protein